MVLHEGLYPQHLVPKGRPKIVARSHWQNQNKKVLELFKDIQVELFQFKLLIIFNNLKNYKYVPEDLSSFFKVGLLIAHYPEERKYMRADITPQKYIYEHKIQKNF